jgi:hypothetical protein
MTTQGRPPACHIDDRTAKFVPLELRRLTRWVTWRWEWDPEAKNGQGKWDKPPIEALEGRPTNATDPSAWTSFDEARKLARHCASGIGIALGPKHDRTGATEEHPGLVGADLDDCIDERGRIDPGALEIVHRFKSYTEYTPSGRGLRVLIWGCKPGPRCKNTQRKIEIYEADRYFTITGRCFGAGSLIYHRQAELEGLYRELFPEEREHESADQAGARGAVELADEELLKRARGASNGDKFAALYDRGDASDYNDNESSADLALMDHLAFWTGRDEARMERLFDASALGEREKWKDRPDYRRRTIAKAIAGCQEVYTPGPTVSDNGEPETSASKPQKKAAAAPAVSAVPTTQRPEIELTTQRHEVTRQAIAALARDQRLYLRGEAFATAYRCPDSDEKLFGGISVRNANGASRIKLLNEPAAGCFLTENATFYKMVELSGEIVPRDCHPPDWLVRSVLAWHERPGFRSLLSIAECPYVARDGSIVSQEGYDPATGTLLSPAFELGAIPDQITETQVTDAFGRLNWLLRGFPFEDGFSFSVWLAALLTAIQRPMIAGPVPGFAFLANKPGCGKGLLIEVIGRLAFGGVVPAFQYPADKTEADKLMISLALGGVQAVHLDNLTEGQFYGNSSLDSALTCMVKGGRILGRNEDVSLPLRPWWVLSGNNLSPGKEAYRRWLPCNLVTLLERPHERLDVSSDELRAYVAQHRSELVTDALSILVAHARAGRPSHGRGKLGSFEEWDDIVRAAVHFATGNDCLTTQRTASEDSPDRLAKLALLEAWREELPDQDSKGYTAAEACTLVGDLADKYPKFHEMLMTLGEKGKPIESKKLGYLIRSQKNTNIGGLKFVEVPPKRHSANVWKVIEAQLDYPT